MLFLLHSRRGCTSNVSASVHTPLPTTFFFLRKIHRAFVEMNKLLHLGLGIMQEANDCNICSSFYSMCFVQFLVTHMVAFCVLFFLSFGIIATKLI